MTLIQTTLLNTLSQRLSLGIVSGNLYLNNKPLPPSMKRQTGFVQQQDVHLSTSTVREALQFTAALRQSHFISQEEKYEYVETVISLLDMGDIAEAIIGEPGAGLNLEQRKRVSIGVELAAKPDILLFLDEPTSGLDGDSAFSIVRLLRKLADSGQTILCTIHQPSFEVISQFDSLLLLVAGGKTAYFGSLGPRCHSVTEYFGRHGRSCHDTENPADYILALAADSSVDWATVWKDSAECKSADNHLTKMLEHVDHAGDALDDSDPKDGQDHIVFAAPPIMQLRFVLGRAFVNYWRDPDYVLGKLQLNCIMGLINGLNFLQMSNTLTESRNHIFSIFIGIITGPVLTLQIEPRFIALRDQFLAREKDAGIYHWSIFVLSASIVEIPFTLVGGLLYWLLWYYTAGFPQSSGTAAYALLMYELYQIFVASVAQLIASLFPTVNGAQLATGFVWLMVNTFNGPLSPPPLTPTGWRWFYNVSPLFYFLDGFASNIMHNMDIVCSKDEISVFAAPDGQTCGEYAAAFFDSSSARGYLIDDTALRECEYCPYVDGDEYVSIHAPNSYESQLTVR
jgi:ABC-type multidrug transport system ATPase subunit/ABC-type multidrug transport system permease subunit